MSSETRSAKPWERIEADEDLVKNAFTLAKRDIKTARHILEDGDHDWSYAISYNAMLQAGRALMFSEGVRPTGKFKHVSG